MITNNERNKRIDLNDDHVTHSLCSELVAEFNMFLTLIWFRCLKNWPWLPAVIKLVSLL